MKIAILQHEYGNFLDGNYLMKVMCLQWQKQGHEILIVTGIGELPQCDVVIVHVDLSKVPRGYLTICEGHPVVINGFLPDISKDIFSELLLQENDNYDEPVIVKTKANYGGIPDARVKRIESGQKRRNKTALTWGEVESLNDYPLFKSIKEVPLAVWKNEFLIVEKFLPETCSDGGFCIRIWVFFGDEEIHFKSYSKDSVIKSGNTDKRKLLDNVYVPEELRDIRKKLDFDYGKFDYAIYNGRPVLYDINKTIGGGVGVDEAIIDTLCQGLKSFL